MEKGGMVLFVLVYNDNAWERLRCWTPRVSVIESDRKTKVYSWHMRKIESVVRRCLPYTLELQGGQSRHHAIDRRHDLGIGT